VTTSRHFSGDSLIVARSVERGEWGALLDPYHLLLHSTAWLAHQSFTAVGWNVRAVFLLQVLSALGGALLVGTVCKLAIEWGLPKALAAVIALACAVSGALWIYSTEGELVTIPVVLMVLLLNRALRAPAPSFAERRWQLRSGMAVGLAILTYATAVFLVPVFALATWLAEFGDLRARGRGAAWFVVGLLLVVGPFAAGGVSRYAAVETPAATLERLAGGERYGRVTLKSLPHGAYAFVRSFALFGGLGLTDRTSDFLRRAGWIERSLFAAYYAIAAGLVVGVLLVPWRIGRGHRERRDRTALRLIALWAGLHAAFAIWWVPGDLEFWLPVLLAWWLALIVALRAALSEWSVLPGFGGGRVAARALGAALLLAALNAQALILPHRDATSNARYRIAMEMSDRVETADLVVVPKDPALRLYVGYFARCPVAATAREAHGAHPAPRRLHWLAAAPPPGPGVWRRDAAFEGSAIGLWTLNRVP
jgi:hypothetical protein